MAGNHPWTAQDDEDLLHLAGSGFLPETVAQVLGRSTSSIQRRLAQLRRVASPPVDPETFLASPGPVEGPPAEAAVP